MNSNKIRPYVLATLQYVNLHMVMELRFKQTFLVSYFTKIYSCISIIQPGNKADFRVSYSTVLIGGIIGHSTVI